MNSIRNIVGLLIILLILPICISAMSYVSVISFNYDEINDEIALSQLRENLLIAYDIDYGYNQLHFDYQNKVYSLSYVNNKLILQPGTQIYLNNIDELHFELHGSIIYVCYERNNKRYERPIVRQGIYLDEFSDCAVDNDEHNLQQD